MSEEMKKRYILIILIVFTIIACKKNTIDIISLTQCNDSQHLDSTAISNKLAGSWIWAKQYCFWSGKTVKSDKTVKATFNSNATFTVSENANLISQGTWKLKIIDNNMWGLDLSTSNNYLYGRILFCDNQVLFNNSYIDGCDNLFNRLQ